MRLPEKWPKSSPGRVTRTTAPVIQIIVSRNMTCTCDLAVRDRKGRIGIERYSVRHSIRKRFGTIRSCRRAAVMTIGQVSGEPMAVRGIACHQMLIPVRVLWSRNTHTQEAVPIRRRPPHGPGGNRPYARPLSAHAEPTWMRPGRRPPRSRHPHGGIYPHWMPHYACGKSHFFERMEQASWATREG
jgi:hypothetical protein